MRSLHKFQLLLCFLSSVGILIWSLYWCGYGFEFTDEGYYLVWISNPNIYKFSTSQFGFIYNILYKLCNGDAVINISADLQDPVELIPEMINSWKLMDSEIVVCHRIEREDHLSAKLFSKLAYRVLHMSMPQIPTGGFDFVLLGRKSLEVFLSMDLRHRFFQGDILWAGYRTKFIPYIRKQRKHGVSQYNFWKKLKFFLDAILDVSYFPIRFISFIGVTTAAVGLIYSGIIVLSWLHGGTPFNGWAPIMIIILISSGLIMCMLGIIGEYIWRIKEEVRKRPAYIVRDKYN